MLREFGYIAGVVVVVIGLSWQIGRVTGDLRETKAELEALRGAIVAAEEEARRQEAARLKFDALRRQTEEHDDAPIPDWLRLHFGRLQQPR